MAHVEDFSERLGAITLCHEVLRQRHGIRHGLAEVRAQFVDAERLRSQAGEQRVSRRGAHGLIAKRLLKKHAAGGKEKRQVRLGGIGEIVAREVARRLDREVRALVLGHLQRGGTPTPFDRVLATQFGAHAVRLIHDGRFGEMVCYRPPEIESVPIADAIRRLATIDPESSAVQAARALGIGFGDGVERSPFAQ